MIHKNENYRRMQRRSHIRHKEAILRHVYRDEENRLPARGSLNKGKVHCSCWLCSFHEYPRQDQKRAASMLNELKDEDLVTEASSTLPRLRKIARNAPKEKSHGSANAQKTAQHVDYGAFLALQVV